VTESEIAAGRASPAFSESSATSASSAGGSSVRPDAYWMVGWDQLVREERHRACVHIVTDQLEHLAGEVVRVMLGASMSQELTVNGVSPAKSTPMGVGEIFSKLKERERDSLKLNKSKGVSASSASSASAAVANSLSSQIQKIDLNTLKKLLDVMRLSSLGTVVKVGIAYIYADILVVTMLCVN
jgi:hypothetical protein